MNWVGETTSLLQTLQVYDNSYDLNLKKQALYPKTNTNTIKAITEAKKDRLETTSHEQDPHLSLH